MKHEPHIAETSSAPSSPFTGAVLRALSHDLVQRVIRSTAAEWQSLPLLDWGCCLLPAHFRLPPSRMHRWLSDELDRCDASRGNKLNVLGPRGSAKSTLGTLAYVLRCALEGREPYIWIVSDTIGQARTHLANVRKELESNALLAAYYPHAIGRGRVWRAESLELANGVVIEAYSTGQHLRGRRLRQHRPTLIICDDLQNDAHMSSASQRQASRDWFHGALLKAGDRSTNIVNFATALHRDALAMELDRSPGWRSRLFRAIERWPERMDLWAAWEERYANPRDPWATANARAFFEERRDAMLAGVELLWPEHEDLYSLMQMGVDEGSAAFEREKQNSPIDPSKCEWPAAYFGAHIWFEDWPHNLQILVMTLDPSKGSDAQHGDYSAFVVLGIDAHGVMFVEADLARRPTPEMVEAGVLLANQFPLDAFGVEANQYQELLIDEFERAFVGYALRFRRPSQIHNTTNKRVRIRTIGPWLARRQLRFRGTSPSTTLLVDQLRDFPLGTHDDGPDALEMAIRLARAATAGSCNDGLGSNLLSH
ncbi:hypothetical protein [Lacipirellula parvula]|uniref:Terminase large subunit gp17-like C-terminal domain-containing protein n=1 Tax=Lacipirellula parvula TaxID=2650471 RepID=A0A5K7XH27_9BACT|nr:hypothetical protein [Lacipirellula parvula]BBO36204.1 hypothetical protein PLANPX_5816 [Lacipirellula parvula]